MSRIRRERDPQPLKCRVVGDKAVLIVEHEGEIVESIIDAHNVPMLESLEDPYFRIRDNNTTKSRYVSVRFNVRDARGRRYRTEEYVHRLIMNPPKWKVVDHINGKVEDNTEQNLRIITRGQNAQNRTCKPRSSTGYRNVYRTANGKYSVQLGRDGKLHYFGTYDTAFEADHVARKKRAELMPFATA